jgi:hypothetical protein
VQTTKRHRAQDCVRIEQLARSDQAGSRLCRRAREPRSCAGGNRQRWRPACEDRGVQQTEAAFNHDESTQVMPTDQVVVVRDVLLDDLEQQLREDHSRAPDVDREVVA